MSSETWLWVIACIALLLHFVGGDGYHRKMQLHRKSLRVIVAMLIKLAKGEILNGEDLNNLRELQEALEKEE